MAVNVDNIKAQMRKGSSSIAFSRLFPRRLVRVGHHQRAESRRDDRSGGTLYPILTRQKNQGLLSYRWGRVSSGPPRKYYTITDLGREYLAALDVAWQGIRHANRNDPQRIGKPLNRQRDEETTNVSIAGIAFRLDNEDTCNSRTTSRGSNWVTKTIPTGGNPRRYRGPRLRTDPQPAIGRPTRAGGPHPRHHRATRDAGRLPRDGQYGNRRNGNVHRQKRRSSERRKRVGHSPLPRRLYRNPEGAKLGGVCSGLGTYFNVEPVLSGSLSRPDSADPAIGHHHARRGTLRFLRDSLLCFFPALFPAVVLHPDGTNPAPKARNAG